MEKRSHTVNNTVLAAPRTCQTHMRLLLFVPQLEGRAPDLARAARAAAARELDAAYAATFICAACVACAAALAS